VTDVTGIDSLYAYRAEGEDARLPDPGLADPSRPDVAPAQGDDPEAGATDHVPAAIADSFVPPDDPPPFTSETSQVLPDERALLTGQGLAEPAAAMRSLAEDFAQDFAAALSLALKCPVRGRFSGLSQLSWEEFLGSIQDPTYCFAVSTLPERSAGQGGLAKNLSGSLEISPSIAFSAVDRLLGGSSSGASVPERPLTAIERRLLRRVLDAAAAGSARTSSPAPARLVPALNDSSWLPRGSGAGQAVIATTFDVVLGGRVGTVRICLAVAAGAGAAIPRPLGRPSAGPLQLSVTTGETEIPPEELSGLAPGDILTTQAPADGEVIVRAAGIPKFGARLGACGGHRAVTITRRLGRP